MCSPTIFTIVSYVSKPKNASKLVQPPRTTSEYVMPSKSFPRSSKSLSLREGRAYPSYSRRFSILFLIPELAGERYIRCRK